MIYNNSVQAMGQIIRGMYQLNIPFSEASNEVIYFNLNNVELQKIFSFCKKNFIFFICLLTIVCVFVVHNFSNKIFFKFIKTFL